MQEKQFGRSIKENLKAYLGTYYKLSDS
uniref:Uncharacterized protein n=1 Tax=Arundo donax TaxID=35708 RepID=A0A0A9DVY0_ARUDO